MQTAIKEPTEEVSALVQGRIFNIQTFVHNCSIRGLTRNWLDQAWVEDTGRYSSDSRSQGLRAGDKNDHYHYKTTTTTTATTTTSHQCPTSEWKVFQSHCYLQVKNHKTQKVCRIVCKGEGGELASIHSQEENQFVADMIKQSQRKVWNLLGLLPSIVLPYVGIGIYWYPIQQIQQTI